MKNDKMRSVISLALPIVITLVLYIPRLPASFVGLDLNAYNGILNGVNYSETAHTLFTDFKGKLVSGYYAPLGSLSLMIDKWLIGSPVPSPRFTVFVNLVLHCANGVLIWLILRSMGASFWVAGVSLYLFLIHPIQVSSIEWFAERKTFLAAIFFFGSYYSYIKNRSSGFSIALLPSLGAFVLGLLSKPTVAVLPVLLLITEFLFPCHETNQKGGSNGPESYRYALDRRVMLSLCPFFLVACGWSVLTLKTEPIPDVIVPLIDRPLVAASAICFYVIHIIVPANVTYIYPRWHIAASEVVCWVPFLALLLVLWLLYKYRYSVDRWIWWGMANFLVPLAPVIGIFQFGYLRYSLVADHFLYISLAGACVSMATVLKAVLGHFRGGLKLGLSVLAAAYFIFLTVQTWTYSAVWQNQAALWSDNIRKCPTCWVAHNGLGVALQQAGLPEQAISHLKRAVDIRPQEAKVYNDLGVALMETGNLSAGRDALNKALSIKPESAEVHYNMGLLMKKLGNVNKAKDHYLKALEEKPLMPEAYNNLGRLFEAEGRIDLALENYEKALECAPYSPEIHSNVANMLVKSDRIEEAIAQYRAALSIKPDHFVSLFNLAAVYINTSRFPEAIAMLQRALAVNPNSAETMKALELAREQLRGSSAEK
ncbi:MAG: tetratricopeptide repeat protein [Desulfomonilaceae bacterium]